MLFLNFMTEQYPQLTQKNQRHPLTGAHARMHARKQTKQRSKQEETQKYMTCGIRNK